MDKDYKFGSKFKIFTIILIVIGVITFAVGFATNYEKTWSNFLLNNYMFIQLAIGGMFWLAIQRITQSGWSAGFIRIPEAMGNYIMIAGVLMLFIYIGMHSLYHWTHHEEVAHDPVLQHKEPYLNIPFFYIRLVVFFIAWIIMIRVLRKYSRKEDFEGGIKYFEKSEIASKIFIFVLAPTFSLASFDWIMSVDPHWYSTIFALKNFVSAFLHGAAFIGLVVIIMNHFGYFSFMNESHLKDFSKYIFIVSIIYGYFWFSQYLLMWYANIPEETIYYVTRLEGNWEYLFYLNIILNTAVPFFVLLSNYVARSKAVLVFVIISVLLGMWVDLYLQIMPGSYGEFGIGWIEIGTNFGFLGIFLFVVFWSLSKRPLIARNHPYLDESAKHHLHE